MDWYQHIIMPWTILRYIRSIIRIRQTISFPQQIRCENVSLSCRPSVKVEIKKAESLPDSPQKFGNTIVYGLFLLTPRKSVSHRAHCPFQRTATYLLVDEKCNNENDLSANVLLREEAST